MQVEGADEEGVVVRGAVAIVLTATVVLAAVSCGIFGNTVSGTITYEGDQAIPDGAVVMVQVRGRFLSGRRFDADSLPDYRESRALSNRLFRAIRAG